MALKNRFLLLVALALPLFAAGTAIAQTSRVYFAGYMGLNVYSDMDFSESSSPASGTIQAANAMSFAGAMGLRIDKQWRVEGELSYRNASMNKIDFSDTGQFPLNGDMSTTLLLANVYYDVDMGWQRLQPFVIGGLGIALHSTSLDDTSGRNLDASDDDIGFAWQVGTGLKYRMADNLAISGGYRYLSGTPVTVGGYEMDFSTHELRVGLEYDLPFK